MKKPERITKTHVYFWGSYLSQWSIYKMKDFKSNLEYSSCEQYMMHKKALLFKDYKIAELILKTNNPQEQKKLGKKVKNFDQKIWDKYKFKIILRGNYLKFTQNEKIRKDLLSTKDKVLVEASPFDDVYGIGLKWNNDLVLDEKNWRGENLLGKALMKVREELIRNMNKHVWFYFKGDDFRSCQECGIIENKNNTESECKGQSKIELRNNIKEVNGSLIDAKEDIIAHGCNCIGGYGAGIAKFMAERFPLSKEEYIKICKDKNFNLGDVQFVENNGKIIANCATQNYYGRYLKMDKDSIEKRYQAIEECLEKIYIKAKKENLSVAIPRIGCGRARADWNKVKDIIRKVFKDYPITVYFIPDRYSK